MSEGKAPQRIPYFSQYEELADAISRSIYRLEEIAGALFGSMKDQDAASLTRVPFADRLADLLGVAQQRLMVLVETFGLLVPPVASQDNPGPIRR